MNTAYSYDSLSRLLSVLHRNGSTTVDGATYTTDNAGNRTTKLNWVSGITDTYSYDDVYELTQVVQNLNGTPTTTEGYSFDLVGNRLSSLGLSPYSYNNSNQLTSTPSATFTYDNNGNTLTKTDSTGVTSYTWDFENRLTNVALPGGAGVAFKYDPLGRRIRKSGSSVVNYVYDGANVVAEYDASGNLVAHYDQGPGVDEPLAMSHTGALSFFETDGLGSVTSLSDSAGGVAATYQYDAFGNLVSASGTVVNPFRYTAREWDGETGLYYYRARYYDASTGRFLSEDTIGLQGGVNVYAYAAASPTNWADPSGHRLSPAECYKLWQSIMDRVELLKDKLAKYDPIADAIGNQPYSAGGKVALTKPASHYAAIISLQGSLVADVYKYWNNCKDGKKIPQCVWEPLNKKVEAPKSLPTTEELRLLEESARYDRTFWQVVTYGDALLGAASGAMYLAPLLPVGAGVGSLAPLSAIP